MQRPRRTSEFHEEAGTLAKRQSRTTQRSVNGSTAAQSPAPATAQKYATRQSRIARPASLDRNAGAALGLQPPSALRSRITPQKTPQSQSKLSTRVLFTAEKQRGASLLGNGGALHNDKRWIQEQMQRISENLRGVTAAYGYVPGIEQEFFARPACLKQMTLKQFLALVNYLLRFISGNRFTVDTNHAEDIVRILQKLHYPHQLNKSWLKTPTAQHSFGNVILLLDFLMDFVPPPPPPLPTAPDDGPALDELHFPLQEQLDHTARSLMEEHFQAPDVEFQRDLLQNAVAGFASWDNNLMDEYSKFTKDTCNKLIMKCCGMPDCAALEAEITKLEKRLAEVEKQRPAVCKEDENQCRLLEDNIKYKKHQLQMTRDDLDTEANELRQLQAKHQTLDEKVTGLKDEIEQMQASIRKQICSADKRNALIEQTSQLKQILEIQERTVSDVEFRNNRQEVLLSRTKKDLTARVEDFNKHMREITYSQLYNQCDDLQLPLNPARKHLQRPLEILQQLAQSTQQRIQDLAAEQQRYEQQINHYTHQIEVVLEPKIKQQQAALASAQQIMQRLEALIKKERDTLDGKLQALEVQLRETQTELEHCELIIKAKQHKIEQLKEANEETMCRAEREYTAYADARAAYLKRYANALEKASGSMQQLEEIVSSNAVRLERAKKHLLSAE